MKTLPPPWDLSGTMADVTDLSTFRHLLHCYRRLWSFLWTPRWYYYAKFGRCTRNFRLAMAFLDRRCWCHILRSLGLDDLTRLPLHHPILLT